MTRFQQHWVGVAQRLELTVRTAHAIDLGQRWFVAPVLLEQFGAVRGMVLVPDYREVDSYTEALVAAGYGYSTVGEPPADPPDDLGIIHVLRDWGWSSDAPPPRWFLEIRYMTGELVRVGDRIDLDGAAGTVEGVVASRSEMDALGVHHQGALVHVEGAGRVFQACPGSWYDLHLVAAGPRRPGPLPGLTVDPTFDAPLPEDDLEGGEHPHEGAGAMKLKSGAFEPGGEIPSAYTADGDDRAPPLAWADAPAGTKSFALIVDDPDAPDPKAPKMTWVHWVLYNVPEQATGLPEGQPLPAGAREGINDWKRRGYGGPEPPMGRHRYFFKLYALDTELPDLGGPTKAALEKAMEQHVLARAELVGTYQKKSW